MKILFFSVFKNQIADVEEIAAQRGVEVDIVNTPLSMENVHLAEGYEAISCAGKCNLGRDVLTQLKHYGVKYISTKAVGYENLDVEACKELELRFSNSSYSPHSVGEFTVMSILTSLRKLSFSQSKLRRKDFTLFGLEGRELHDQTVGVIGTGKIGQSVVKRLSGFGCRIIAHDLHESNEVKGLVEYLPLQEVLQQSDVITLHAPLLESTYHLLDESAFKTMKDNVCIVNNARGELIDSEALINALKSGKVSAAALDVIEDELDFFRYDYSEKEITHKSLNTLLNMDNVQITTHHSFFTRQASVDMVNSAIMALQDFKESGYTANQIC
ncbi:NAD(P)-dependent oxidoreductase [Reinekea marinisedimentorum]|uniref:D-lactate dehydrogenase n=1 Tax=Reinekea marinisedimentorum TaxID=230495 RepID=A0A4R3HZX4_9GAMM|nr:NAD(P)-dependent oxidoreductase [Reinekea marinisedimentorum]TCS38808.1 D-lactate dehydrogenase [Reinekea marinisedimentorum]